MPTNSMDPRVFHMHRITVITPAITNAFERSEYRSAFREALLAHDFTGWTEHETVGYWHGRGEPGTLFEFYSSRGPADAVILGRIARHIMPDQEAIQVTLDPGPTTLMEF